MEYKKGDIGVRIDNRYKSDSKIGDIYKAVKNTECKNSCFYYEDRASMSEDCCRPATQLEIEAYNKGIRNISDIPKTPKKVELNYEIY